MNWNKKSESSPDPSRDCLYRGGYPAGGLNTQ